MVEQAEPNWEALKGFSDEVIVETPVVETPAEVQTKDAVVENTPVEIKEEVKTDAPEPKTEPVVELTPEEKTALATEAKSLGLKEDASKEEVEAFKANIDKEINLELTADVITDVPKEYEDGTFQGLAKELGVEIAEESFDAFKNSFVPKAELEKVQKQTKEALFTELNPEVAATLQLKELGIPDELLLTPTKNIEANITYLDSLLSLSNEELCRKEFEASPSKYTPEEIDAKMESIVADGKLEITASVIRKDLTASKESQAAQKEQILSTKDSLIKQYTERKEAAQKQEFEKEKALVKEALYNMTDLWGNPLTPAAKDAIYKKYESGAYNEDFKNAKLKADFIVQKEYGSKVIEHLKNKAFSKGKEEIWKKESNIVPLKGVGGGITKEQKPIDDNWIALQGFAG